MSQHVDALAIDRYASVVLNDVGLDVVAAGDVGAARVGGAHARPPLLSVPSGACPFGKQRRALAAGCRVSVSSQDVEGG